MNTLMANASTLMSDDRRRLVAIVLGSVAVAIVFAFWNQLGNLWFRWGQSQELSHSYFLPLIALWMLWERRAALMPSLGAPALAGFLPLVGGLFLLFLGALTHIFVLQHIGFVVTLISLPLLFGGWSLLLVTIVPLAYLFFMVPPPYWVITVLSGKFQLMSSQLGVAMIRMMDIPVFLSGNVIQLSSTRLAVVEACSGLRYLFPFLSLGALAAYFYQGPLWQRIVIFLSTIPITIVMNSFRIAAMGYLAERVTGEVSDGFMHYFEGWVVFLLCIALLLGVIWIFTLVRGHKNPLTFVGFVEVPPSAPTGSWSLSPFVRNGVIAAGLILLAGVVVHTLGSRALIIPDREPFAVLPYEFEGWDIEETTLDTDVATTLGADDYIIMDMVSPEGDYVNVYMAYLEAQRDGRSWHSPMQCLPGGGWEIATLEAQEMTRADGRTYYHNRMIIQQGDDRRLVYYWYEQRGRKIANEFIMKFSVMWDALIRQRSDGAMIRLMTPILPEETVDVAEARLEKMRVQLEPKLDTYIPE